MKKILSLTLCLILCAFPLLTLTACESEKEDVITLYV